MHNPYIILGIVVFLIVAVTFGVLWVRTAEEEYSAISIICAVVAMLFIVVGGAKWEDHYQLPHNPVILESTNSNR